MSNGTIFLGVATLVVGILVGLAIARNERKEQERREALLSDLRKAARFL